MTTDIPDNITVEQFCEMFKEPFKLSESQREFIKNLELLPDRTLIVATRGQLKRWRAGHITFNYSKTHNHSVPMVLSHGDKI